MNETVTKQQKIQSAVRIMGMIFIVGVFAAMIAIYAPDVITILRSGDEEAMEEYISGASSMGVLVLVLLQVLQTITIFFPGIPIYMCAGIIYGRWLGTLICYITYVVINCLVFIAAGRMKESARTLINNDKNSKLEEMMKKTKHPILVVVILCIFPVVPNGIVPYIAQSAGISLRNFFIAVATGCIPGIFLFVWCGDLLMSKYFWLIIGLMIAALALVILGFVFKSKLSAFAEKIIGKLAGSKED